MAGAVGRVDEVEALEQLAAARAWPPARAHAVEAARPSSRFSDAGEVLVDRRVLAGEPDPLAQLGGVAHDVEPGDARGAGVGLQQRRQHAHRGRLAGAVGAEQPEHGARRRLEVDAVERPDVAEGLDEARHADRRLVAGRAADVAS